MFLALLTMSHGRWLPDTYSLVPGLKGSICVPKKVGYGGHNVLIQMQMFARLLQTKHVSLPVKKKYKVRLFTFRLSLG